MKKITSILVLAFIALGSVFAVTAYDQSDISSSQNCEDMKNAFDNNNYYEWKSIVEVKGSKGRVLELVNENNFELFVEAREAKLSGDLDKYNEIRSELGFGNKEMNGEGYKNGGSNKNMAHNKMQNQKKLNFGNN